MRTSCSVIIVLLLPIRLVAGNSTPLRIVCIGDSVTKAANVKPEERFCAILESGLKSNGRPVTVINSGVGSDTTELGLKRFEQDVLAHKPTHVFIMFGLNDAYRPENKAPLVPLDRYATNLRAMVATLRGRKIVAILMTSNPHGPGSSENTGLKPYIEACRAVARTENIRLVDVYAHFAERAVENQWQRLYAASPHLNAEGNRVIAELMANWLQASIAVKR